MPTMSSRQYVHWLTLQRLIFDEEDFSFGSHVIEITKIVLSDEPILSESSDQRWEFMKENKKVRKQELDRERDQENKKKERKQELDQESDQKKRKNFIFF